ncbi:MAG: Secreted protein [Halothiobacillaceae bacterium]|nr:MAG: Secreted protein [Halothiobacillaceae bacterium]
MTKSGLLLSLVAFAVLVGNAEAADSYRWLHVTIETPWAIFLFLLPMVLIPVVLMAILYWRFAWKATNGAPPAENKIDHK